jgi:CRISPR/Cas system-associated exonuclease Cas4 (RecB family)
MTSSRVVKKASDRTVKSPVRRITKDDGKLAKYSSIKSETGIVIPECRKVLLDRRKKEEQEPRIRRGLYPSEMSQNSWCPRASFLRMSGATETPSSNSFSLENVFAVGNQIHEKYQGWLGSTGLLWGDWKCSKCGEYVKDSLKPEDNGCVGTSWIKIGLPLSQEYPEYPHNWRYKEVTLKSVSLPVSGHADGGLIKHNILVELKSLSAGGIKWDSPKLAEAHTHKIDGKYILDIDGLWKAFHSPMSSHIKQGQLYLWMANEMSLPFDRISFVYELKSNQQTKEFIVPYSYEIVRPMIETAQMIVKALEDKREPACVKGTSCGECRKYSLQ